MNIKRVLVAGGVALCLALPASAALAADDLTIDIQHGQSNKVAADVQAQVNNAESEQAGEVGENGEVGEVAEHDEDQTEMAQDTSDKDSGDSTQAAGSTGTTAGGGR